MTTTRNSPAYLKDQEQITHVIFDMDGILLNTEPIYSEITQEVLTPYGLTFDWSLKSKMMGRNNLEAAKILVEELGLPFTGQDYLDSQQEMFKVKFPLAEPMQGAIALSRFFHESGIPMAVATSTHCDLFEIKTSRHKKWFSIYKEIVTGDDCQVKKSKPAPDIFLIAAKRIEAKPENCLVFEDSITGVEAACAAKMKVIAVPDPKQDKSQYGKAHLILDSLNQFDPAFWNLDGTFNPQN